MKPETPRFIDGILRFACGHVSMTEPDESGRAICERCGAVVQTRLTVEVFEAAMRRLKGER